MAERSTRRRRAGSRGRARRPGRKTGSPPSGRSHSGSIPGDIALPGRGGALGDTRQLTLEEIVAAGRVLFGPAFAPDGGSWRAALRTVYRRRALETHPDRARATGRSEAELGREFRRVSEAYHVLSALSAGPLPAAARPRATPAGPAAPQPRRSARPAAQPDVVRPRARAAPGGVRAATELPRRRLRFAEYLYYSGRIPWTVLVDAIAWQRRQRPAVGRIAVDFGFLTSTEVSEILERRRIAEAQRIPFGEFAVRLGYLTPVQLLAMLGRQLRQQRRIGAYLVERGLIDEEEIEVIRMRIARHNARWG